MNLEEMQKHVDGMERSFEDRRRKIERGLEGEEGIVIEDEVQDALELQFPGDLISTLPKVRDGARLLQQVRDTSLKPRGRIIWEIKNAKSWQTDWLDMLKADQHEAGALISILVTNALPEGIGGYAMMKGVWACNFAYFPYCAVSQRDSLMNYPALLALANGKK
jgi:hypothetical protein